MSAGPTPSTPPASASAARPRRPPGTPLLEVRDLVTRFSGPRGSFDPVAGVSFRLAAGETLGLVGESGCGKTLTALSLLRLLPKPGRIAGGQVRLEGQDLVALPEAAMTAVRGRRMAMIFQEPMSALNPVFTCGDQVAEPLRVLAGLSRREALERAVELLRQVGIADPGGRARDYPHQLSGGMRQRVMIAMALALDPEILVADEPTTALDVTIQAQILDLLRQLREERGLALLLITHNLGVVRALAERVAVMYAGRIVEEGPVETLLSGPRHPYARGLLDSVPRLGARRARLAAIPGQVPAPGALPPGCAFAPRCPLADEACRSTRPLLEPAPGALAQTADGPAAHAAACFHADRAGALAFAPPAAAAVTAAGGAKAGPLARLAGVGKSFPVARDWRGRPRRLLRAVHDVNLELRAGETLGLVGESGCGKTTLGRLVVRLLAPTEGTIEFEGRDLAGLRPAELRALRGGLQIVFQDPVGSLNPRLTVGELLREPLEVHGVARGTAAERRAAELLDLVGLPPEALRRFPHEFSGGQRQRIGIARALSLEPRLVVLDEPVSALDVSVQAQVLNLLADLKARLGLAYLFVAHDLAVVRHLADRVAVMYLGEIVELADTEELYARPLHPYTKALLAAVPRVEPGEPNRPVPLAGEPPNPANPPAGCPFHPRCPLAQPSCAAGHPPLKEVRPGHLLRCPVVEGSGAFAPI